VTTVWLVRHGSPDSVKGRCYGRYDVPLSAEGLCQAKNVAAQLAKEAIARVYSSGLRRARDTACIVAEPHGLTVETVDDLAEIDFGRLDGLTYEEIEERHPEVFRLWMARPTEVRFPGGESFRDLSLRVGSAFERLLSRHRNESIAVVAHAGVIRVILCQALSMPEKEIFRLAQRYGAINRITWFEHGPVVELING
jgi:alpha-ribazole phosphatase